MWERRWPELFGRTELHILAVCCNFDALLIESFGVQCSQLHSTGAKSLSVMLKCLCMAFLHYVVGELKGLARLNVTQCTAKLATME